MGIRGFDRIYYDIERQQDRSLVCPRLRVSFDEGIGSLVERRPRSAEPIEVLPWRRALQQDADAVSWGAPAPLTVDDLIDLLILYADATPLTIDGTESWEGEGTYRDGGTARAFSSAEEVTFDDIRVAAFEEMDAGACEREDEFRIIHVVEGPTLAMVLDPFDATLLCAEMDLKDVLCTHEPMRVRGLEAPVNLTPICYAVLRRYRPSSEWVLIGATADHEMASQLACYHEGQLVTIQRLS